MEVRKKCLVTGGNGHLGNNLVKELVAQGYEVKASVRNTKNRSPFTNVDCEVVYADMTDKASLLKVMDGVDVVFHTAAVFKHWAIDAEKEIHEPNRTGTRNILEAAAECKVKKVIYVSSIAALDHDSVPMNEKAWSKEFPNAYYESKQKSEQLAWKLAKELDIDLITVLPSSMLGADIYGQLTPTMTLMNNIITNQLPFDPVFGINFVSVKDVAKGMVMAEQNGRSGNRYILATELSITTSELLQIAKEVFPETEIPAPVPKPQLLAIAQKMEDESEVTGQAPFLFVDNVNHYYNADARVDISKAYNELGYRPMKIKEVIIDAFRYLKELQD